MVDLTPYSTVKPLMGPLDSWLTPDEAERLAAYGVYEAIYRNVPAAFKLVQRGDEQNPIYIPSAKTIIEAKNRFLAKGWTFAVEPLIGTPEERLELETRLTSLFRREKVWSKFANQKRFGMIRGDQVWQIVADEGKPEGRRISIYEVDPASYFPIYDPWNSDKVLGVHLVDPVENAAGKTVIKRQTYRKEDNGRISYELSWWEVGAWDDRYDDITLKKVTGSDIPAGDHNVPDFYELPEQVTSLPVYHVKNNATPGAPYGTSELAGFETLIAGINQMISDEDLTLVMQGLGLYWTNSGPPTDDDGNEVNWQFGPGWVVEIDEGATFGRVSGASSIEPMLNHMSKLESSMREAAGVPDIAIGSVDVQTAESGIALAFKMAPILSGNEEKEGEILATTDQLMYDLVTMWFPAFESYTTAARAVSITQDPLPVNRAAILKEVTDMLATDPPLISVEYARTILQEKLGYNFPTEMAGAVVDEARAFAEARNVDPFAARVAAELGQGE